MVFTELSAEFSNVFAYQDIGFERQILRLNNLMKKDYRCSLVSVCLWDTTFLKQCTTRFWATDLLHNFVIATWNTEVFLRSYASFWSKSESSKIFDLLLRKFVDFRGGGRSLADARRGTTIVTERYRRTQCGFAKQNSWEEKRQTYRQEACCSLFK